MSWFDRRGVGPAAERFVVIYGIGNEFDGRRGGGGWGEGEGGGEGGGRGGGRYFLDED